MRSTHRVARNVLWNQAGMAVDMLLVGFLLLPFLLNHLGTTNYALWTIIASMTGYFGMLDLGIRGSVGRYIAFHRAQGDRDGMNSTLSTGMALLSGAAMAGLVATLGIALFFFRILDVPEESVADVRLAIILVGVNLALMLLMNLFDATLWAFQRFDLLNFVDIPTSLARAGLTYYFVRQGGGVVALATINLCLTVFAALAKAVLSFAVEPSLRLSLRHVSKATAKTLYGYSIWLFLLQMARTFVPRLAPLIVGYILALDLVPPYHVATRFMAIATAFMVATTGVFTPIAASFVAQKKKEDLKRLFLDGGKYCLALSLFFLALFVFFAKPFITLWIGPHMAVAAGLLVLMALGETLPLSQLISYTVLLGTARHRLFALASLAENGVALILVFLLAPEYGLPGVCLAFAIPGFLCRGVFQLIYACRVLEIPVREYLRRAIFPPLFASALPITMMALLIVWKPPSTWIYLIGYGVVFGLLNLPVVISLLGIDRLRAMLGKARADAVVPVESQADWAVAVQSTE